MSDKIELGDACCVAREFMRFMLGSLNLNSYLIEHAHSVEKGYIVRCSIKPAFKNERMFYLFMITFDGVVKSMKLEDRGVKE